MNELENVLKKEFIEGNSRKIKDETLIEYLTSFKRDELMQCALVPLITNRTKENLSLAQTLIKQNKEEIIKYIQNNITYIVESYIKVFSKKDIDALKEIIEHKDAYHLYEMPFTLLGVDRIRQSGLVYFEYNKKEDTIEFGIQNDIKEELTKALNNKELIKLNTMYNEVYTFTTQIVDAYGIVELETTHQIFEKLMYQISYDEFSDIITSKTITDEYKIHNYDNKYILSNVEFIDDNDFKDFYFKQTGEYKLFTKEEYKKLSDETYVEDLKPYKKLIKYLCDNYEGIEEDIDDIRFLVIMDYIYTAQVSSEKANKRFFKNIEEFIEADFEDEEEILAMIQDIFSEYPKWIKRGEI